MKDSDLIDAMLTSFLQDRFDRWTKNRTARFDCESMEYDRRAFYEGANAVISFLGFSFVEWKNPVK